MRTVNINDYVYRGLLDAGYVPSNDEVFTISALFYDLLHELDVVRECPVCDDFSDLEDFDDDFDNEYEDYDDD